MATLFNILALAVVVLTAYLYHLGVASSFFWYYPWYDIPIHILGGLTIGLYAGALAARRGLTPRRALVFALLLAIAIGAVWEIFEYWANITRGEPGFWFDTFKDLLDDVIGSTLASAIYWFFSRFRK